MSNRQNIEFKTLSGVTLRGWLYPSETQKKGPGIILSAGVCISPSYSSFSFSSSAAIPEFPAKRINERKGKKIVTMRKETRKEADEISHSSTCPKTSSSRTSQNGSSGTASRPWSSTRLALARVRGCRGVMYVRFPNPIVNLISLGAGTT